MIDAAVNSLSLDSFEAALREKLARGDAATDGVVPILRYFLANERNSIFSDEVVASVHGMLADIARQLLGKLNEISGDTDWQDHAHDEIAALTDGFIENYAFVGHVHALALEWQFTHRLHTKLALDPVLSPLLQTLIASQDTPTSALAMKLLAAQARFCHSQRRMRLPLHELPADLLHNALLSMRTLASTETEVDERAAAAEAQIRADYDEAASRLGLISRLVEGLGNDATGALCVTHAGTAIFLSALAIGSGQGRDATVLSTDEAQVARLALALRSAGIKLQGIEEQLLALHPDICLPEGFDRLSSDRAAAILALASYQGA